jgi:hypothetical protein
MLINADNDLVDWCNTTDHAEDVDFITLPSTLEYFPFQACYDIIPNTKDMQIWGCHVLIPNQER